MNWCSLRRLISGYCGSGATVSPRAGHLHAVDVPAVASGGAQLLKLAVEGLPVDADAGIADEPFFFGVSCDDNL
jgi:hypothetical protein